MRPSENYKDFSPLSSISTAGFSPPISIIFFSCSPQISEFSALAEAIRVDSKPTGCGCKKSKCLRLYCECLADDKYCRDCNCKNCHNTPAFIEERTEAIAKIKKKRPYAVKSDISSNYQICHCSKSGCVKNYCECYQKSKFCSSNCKCLSCKNTKATTP